MLETKRELDALQQLLDRGNDHAGTHRKAVVTEARCVGAEELVAPLQGMRLLVLTTTTASGRPIDGYFLRGRFWFSSARTSVRMRHLAQRPFVSATHLPGEDFAVSVHGQVELFALAESGCRELKQAMLDHYLPRQGPQFGVWLEGLDTLGGRIEAERMFTFQLR